MKQYGFRHRILLLAVALVVATQLIVLFPVLDLIKRDSAAQAERTVGLAGVLFDEYMHNRADQLLTTVNVLVSDYGFKQAVVSRGDAATIQSVLRNHANRVGASVAALLDLDGTVIVSSTADERQVPSFPSVPFATLEEGTRHRVITIGGVPYQTVTVPLRAPGHPRVGHARLPDRRSVGDASAKPHGPRHFVRVRDRRYAARAELDATRRCASECGRRPRLQAHRCAAHRARCRRAPCR